MFYLHAEALAIFEAAKYFTQSVYDDYCIVLSDSLNAITSLKNIVDPSDVARNIQDSCHIVRSTGKHLSFMWIPGHSNISGNEKADEVARLSYSSPKTITIPGFSYTNTNKFIKNHTTKVWQRYWSKQTTKFNEIKMSMLPWSPPSDCSRRQETIISRLRIGHTSLTAI